MNTIDTSYQIQGYSPINKLLNREVTAAISRLVRHQMAIDNLSIAEDQWYPDILNRASLDVYNDKDSPLYLLLLGFTPLMEKHVGIELLPTYNYFRVYRKGDICKIHSDREACEHSMTLALINSDNLPWSFEVGRPVNAHHREVSANFGDEPHDSFAMMPGDAVIYRGIDIRHGRVNKNPNEWSAHMFFHWVEKDGDYAHLSFEGKKEIAKPDFAFT